MSFVLITILHSFCIANSIVLLALSIVNFGLLLTWVNSITAISALIYHIAVLITNKLHNARAGKPWNRRSFIHNLMKMLLGPPPSQCGSSVVVYDEREAPSEFVLSGPFYSDSSLFSMLILIVIALIGFIMTVDVLLHGALSLPAGGRENGTAFHLDMKVQTAQCTLLGVQISLWLVALTLCVRGRRRIWEAVEEERDEFQLGYTSRGVSQNERM
jgi:hypothetical protein